MSKTLAIPLGAWGILQLPQSTITTWCLMAVLVALALVVRRHRRRPGLGVLENAGELFMEKLCELIHEIVRADPAPFVPFVGTLFIFVFCANLIGMVPGLSSPTADLSVTAGLATLVFLSIPFYGIRAQGLRAYLKGYLQPNPFLLPFNLLGEITRTLALAVRLFGNIMSGEFLFLVVVGVLTTTLKGYATVFMPAGYLLTLFLSVLGLIAAVIQAYIFAVLTLVYIGAAVERRADEAEDGNGDGAGGSGVA